MTQLTSEEMFNKVAVVGMSGRYPGSKDLKGFWDNLLEGRNTITYYTEEELLELGIPAHLLAHPDYVRAQGRFDEPFAFDAGFFGYNPREAAMLDPQHRVFLEHAWSALEDAGYDPNAYPGRIGVYAGGGVSNYLFNIIRDPNIWRSSNILSLVTSNDKDYLATRVGYKLNLQGPCVNVQTACSTSLVAIVQALQSVLNYTCDMVIAGGVRLDASLGSGYMYTEGSINSPDGYVRTFDEGANGTLFANGVGVVIFKRLEDAIRDGDTIHAVVLGYGISNDGSGRAGFTAPGVQGQFLASSDSIAMAGINPETIAYVECHGTATPVGDPIEIAALTKSFRLQTQRTQFCAVGSVKTNIGHADTAAGVAGFIKTVLTLRNRTIPASLNYVKPNPSIDFENSPFFVNTSLTHWKGGPAPFRAAVNAFGMGGTNANVLMEEPPPQERTETRRPIHLMLLSARTQTALNRMSANLAERLRQEDAPSLADTAYTLQVGRRTFGHRRFLLAKDVETCLEVLGTENSPGAITVQRDKDKTAVAFLFPGQGAQHPNMARGVYEAEPLFQSIVDECCETLKPHMGLDLRDLLFPAPEKAEQAAEKLAQTSNTQPALFVVEYALAKLWMAWGQNPEGMIGHSVGEYVAACLAGVFSLDDALSLIAARGRLMEELPAGCMSGVLIPKAELVALLANHPGLSLAAVNAPSSCVASGPFPEMERFEAELTEKGVPFRRLKTSHAFHSAMMDPICERFTELVQKVPKNAPVLPYLSNVTGTWIKAQEATDPHYWTRHLRQAVLFSEGVGELLKNPGMVLLEVGPGSTLSNLVAQNPAKTADCASISSLPRATEPDQDAFETLLLNLGRLWSEGLAVDWQGFYEGESHRRVSLPTYPFEHQDYRLEFGENAPAASESADHFEKLADIANWFNVPSWKRTAPLLPRVPSEPLKWLLFLDEFGLGQRVSERLQASGQDLIRVAKGDHFERREDGSYTLRVGDRDDYISLMKALRAENHIPTEILHFFAVRPGAAGPVALEETDEALEHTFYSLLFLAASLGLEFPGLPINLRAVTCDANNVDGEECVSPFNALVAGPIKSVSRDQPNIKSQWVDVRLPGKDKPAIWDAMTHALVLEFLTEPEDEVVAYRNTWRWIQAFDAVHIDAPTELLPKHYDSGAYLITGGLGGLGLSFATHLASTQSCNLVLVGRSGLPARDTWDQWLKMRGAKNPTSLKIQSIWKIEAMGSKVLVAAADVSNLDQMAQVLEKAKAAFGPIRGIIHTAGVAGQGIIELKTKESADQVLAPKVKGTLVLDRVFKDEPLDFFVICSSLIGYIGIRGQVDYTAGNTFIDAFVNSNRHACSVRPQAIDYDRWEEVGMATAIGHRSDNADLVYEEIQHPVFTARFEKDGDRIYVGYLKPDEHWIVGEHFLRSIPTLVGTSYVELARSAFLYDNDSPKAELWDVVFMGVLMMEQEDERELQVVLKNQGAFTEFEIRSQLPFRNKWQTHAMGKIGPLADPTPRYQDLPAILERCPKLLSFRTMETVTGEEPGLLGLQTFIQVGQRWNGLVSIAEGTNEALATLSLPEAYLADIGTFAIHPALLDVATSFALRFAGKGASYLPFAYDRIRVHRPLTPKLYSYSRFTPAATETDEFLSFDIILLDEQGEELASIDGYGMKRVTNMLNPALELKAGGLSKAHPSGVQRYTTFLRTEEGVEVFRRALSMPGLPQVMLSLFDFKTRVKNSLLERNTVLEAPKEETAPSNRHPRPSLSTPFIAPRNPLEVSIAGIWQSILGIDEVGVQDNFMDLGGHSLIAIQMTARVRELFEIELSVAAFYKNPTVEGVSLTVVETLIGSSDPESMAEAIASLEQA